MKPLEELLTALKKTSPNSQAVGGCKGFLKENWFI